MATHSSVLAWRIPGKGEPGGLPSMGSHRVRHDWSNLAAAAAAEGFVCRGVTQLWTWSPRWSCILLKSLHLDFLQIHYQQIGKMSTSYEFILTRAETAIAFHLQYHLMNRGCMKCLLRILRSWPGLVWKSCDQLVMSAMGSYLPAQNQGKDESKMFWDSVSQSWLMKRITWRCLLKIDSRLFPRRLGFKRSGVRTGNLYLLNIHGTNTISLVWRHCSKGGWFLGIPA